MDKGSALVQVNFRLFTESPERVVQTRCHSKKILAMGVRFYWNDTALRLSDPFPK
jgi:hypothetical protein